MQFFYKVLKRNKKDVTLIKTKLNRSKLKILSLSELR